MLRVTSSLDNDEALLEYVLTQSGNAYCLFMSRKNTAIVRLGSAKQIDIVYRDARRKAAGAHDLQLPRVLPNEHRTGEPIIAVVQRHSKSPRERPSH
jgi:hypothetical protein